MNGHLEVHTDMPNLQAGQAGHNRHQGTTHHKERHEVY